MMLKKKFESLSTEKNGKRTELQKWDNFAMEYLNQRFPTLSEKFLVNQIIKVWLNVKK